jgi:hypothetical protein
LIFRIFNDPSAASNKMERSRRGVGMDLEGEAVTYFKVLYRHSLGETEKNDTQPAA